MGSPIAAQQEEECFGPDVFESPAGDLVEVTTSCSGYILVGGDRTPDDNKQTNYFDILYVPNGGTFTVNTRLLGTNADWREVYSDGVVSYAHKYGASTGAKTTKEFSDLRFVNEDGPEITNLKELRNEIGITTLPRPLQPERYRLLATANGTIVVRDNGIPYAKEPLDRSNIRLTEPDFGGIVDTYIAPPLDADGVEEDNIENLRRQWTQRATVAQHFRNIKGDRIIVEFEGSGIWGTLQNLTSESVVPPPSGAGPQVVEELNGLPEGVHLSITQTNPDSNQEPMRFNFESASDDEAYLYFGNERVDEDTPNPERFYLVIDTTDSSSFGRGVSDGDQFRIEFAYNSTSGNRYRFPEMEHDDPPQPPWDSAVSESNDERIDQFPYFDRSDTTARDTVTFTVEEPYVRYEYTTDDDEVILSTSQNAQIDGETNIAPGTDTSIQIVSEDDPPPDRITIEDLAISQDGSFTATADLSTLNPEFPLEIEFFKREKLLTRRPVVITDDPESPAELRLLDATERVTITEGERLAALSATVGNDGVADGNAHVLLTIDGDRWGNRSVTVTPERNRTVAFDGARPSMPPGEYPYTVRLAGTDQSLSGTLVIEPRATPEPTATSEPAPSTARPPTATPDDTPQSPPTATDTPGATNATATNASAPDEAQSGSLIGGLSSYVASVLPYTLGSMVFVVVAYVVARVVVARRGGSEAS